MLGSRDPNQINLREAGHSLGSQARTPADLGRQHQVSTGEPVWKPIPGKPIQGARGDAGSPGRAVVVSTIIFIDLGHAAQSRSNGSSRHAVPSAYRRPSAD